jgi:hypothetical protein
MQWYVGRFITQLVYVLAAYGRGLQKHHMANPNRHIPLAGVVIETKISTDFGMSPHGCPLTAGTPTAGGQWGAMGTQPKIRASYRIDVAGPCLNKHGKNISERE